MADVVFSSIVFLFILLVVVGGFAVWVWTLVDVLRVPNDGAFRTGNQLVWVLVIVLTQIIGSIIYLVIGRPDRAHR